MAKKKKLRITAEDLYRFHIITSNQMSPDGEYVIYSLQRINKKAEKKFSNLWIVPTRGGKPEQFTYGDHIDTQPRWSPDGKRIGFISNRGNEKQPQVYIIPFHGGEARPLTDLKGRFGSFEWSPDGREIVFTFRKKDKEEIEREKNEQKKKLGVVSRQITRIFFKYDGEGYLPKERWHIWTVNTKTGKSRQLTDSGIYDEYSPSWSPDGKRIVFLSNRSKDPDLNPDAVDIFIIPKTKGRIKKLKAPVGWKSLPRFSPDGRWIAYYGMKGRGQWWRNTHLWIVPGKGKGKVRDLTRGYDFNISSWTINDLGSPPLMPPTWSKNGERIYFQVAHHGDTVLKVIYFAGKKPTVRDVISEDGVVGSFNLDDQEKRLAYFHADMKDVGQIWTLDLKDRSKKKLTNINDEILNKIDLGQIEEVWFRGPDRNRIQGWILKPPGFRKTKKYPSVLEIHGGPRVQYGNFFFHEFYFLAANGYVVHFCNPRGGQGYGEAHSKAIWNNWGTVDYQDVMAWASYISRKPYIDKKRMGVTGGSYGGYMTNWIIGHTDKFRAAVTQRSVSNLISMWGSSDGNWAFQYEFGGKPPWQAFHNYWRQSPMRYIGRTKTPTLVIHSEHDFRCAIEQGEQVYVALKKLGVPTEMVRFPNEPHGLSRTGRTDRRIERLRHILRWFDRFLKKKP